MCTFFAAQIEKHSEVNQAREGSVETDLSCVLTALSLPFEKCPEVGVGHKSVWKAWSSLYAAVASNVSLVMNYKVCCSNDLFLSMNNDQFFTPILFIHASLMLIIVNENLLCGDCGSFKGTRAGRKPC